MRYKSREPVLDLLFGSGSGHERFRLTRPRDADSESEAEIESKLDEIKQKHPIVDLKPKRAAGASVSLNNPFPQFTEALLGIEAWGQTFYEDYNNRLGEYYRQYERYLRDATAFKTLPARTMKLTLVLSNSGSCPAEDIYVLLHFPDGFQLYDDEHPPKQPAEPPVPSKDMFPGLSLTLPSYLANLHASPQFYNPRLPRIRKTNSYDVTYQNDKLLHGFVWNLNPLYVAFDSWESISSLSIDYTVHAGNMIDERTGKLGVAVEVV